VSYNVADALMAIATAITRLAIASERATQRAESVTKQLFEQVGNGPEGHA
jgi:hypothetical protein